jgi:type IV pilus assembly protein PilF
MWLKALLLACCVSLVATGCTTLERLTIIRPSAHSRGYTKISPSYDVSGKQTQQHNADGLLASATQLYQQGNVAQAEQQAKQALKANPKLPDAHTLLGVIAATRGDSKAAGRFYQQAVAIAPENGIYANNYGGWLCANRQETASLPWFNRALADPMYPTPVMASVNAGVCAKQAGQGAQAEAYWRHALAFDPQQLTALAGIAQLAFESDETLEARAFVERWLEISPNDPAGLQLAAQIEQKRGDNTAASRYLLRLQALPSNSSPATQNPR